MRKLIAFCLRHYYVPIIIISTIVTISILNIKEITIDTSERSLIIQNDPDLEYYDETIKLFVSDNVGLVYIEDDHLFTYNKLKKIENMINKIRQIDGVIKVESLFNVTNIKNEDDFLSLNKFADSIPNDQAKINQIKKDALNNPIIVSNLISKDAKKFVVKIFFNEEESKKDKLFEINIINKVEKILEKNKSSFKNSFQIGNPYIKKKIYDTIQIDGRKIIPISIIVLLGMLIITIRSVHGAMLPLLTSSISVLATVVFMGMLEIPINLLTFIVPSLLIVIGSTEDIHIISEYFEGLRLTNNKYQTILYLGKKVGTAILITSITTFLGFLSISINKIMVLRQFGYAAAFGLIINPIVTIFLAPVYLKFFGPKKANNKKTVSTKISNIFDFVAGKISNLIIKYNKFIIGAFLLISVVFGLFIFRVQLNYDLLNNFEKKSIINTNIDIFQENLSGINTFFIRIKGNKNEAFTKPEYLTKIDQLKYKLESIEGIDKVLTVADYIKLMNREMNIGDPTQYIIPNDEFLISQYFLLIDPVDIQKYITPDFGEANIIIKHGITSSKQLDSLINKINEVIPKYTRSIGEYKLTGFQLLTKKAAYSIATGTVQGTLLLMFIIFIIMSILFVNIKAGLISLLTNTAPVILCFGLMGIFNIPLNIGSCLVAIIALGLAVDDTIHLMSKYKYDMREHQDHNLGIAATIKSELVPAFSTSISLGSLFFSLTVSNLVNIKNFGLLSGIVIIYAFFCDIFLTTTLLTKVQLITLIDILTMKVKKDILNSKLLKGLKLRQVKELFLMGSIHELNENDYIIKENEIGNNICIILTGKVEVSTYDKTKKKTVIYAELGEGDVIGEISLLSDTKRTANIICKSYVKYFTIEKKGIERIQKHKPRIAGKILFNLSNLLTERVVNMNERYRDKVL